MKNISVLALSMHKQNETKCLDILENNLKGGEDIVVLNEFFIDDSSYSLDDPFVNDFKRIAQKHNTHILLPLLRKINDSDYRNSAVWINRQGEILFIYDKIFPYWSEYPQQGSRFNTIPGSQTEVFETDIGRVSAAICFDANFAELWLDIAVKNADIVFFESAYSSGRQLAAHALCHHYIIVACTRYLDFSVFDIDGREIQYNRGSHDNILVSRAMIDTDKVICHHNFNIEKIRKMLAENPGVIIENNYHREEWIVLRSFSNEINVRDICKTYGIESLRDYQNRSREFAKTRRKDSLSLITY